jgi:hypothetical protein
MVVVMSAPTPWIASQYLDSADWGVIAQDDTIVIGISSRITKEHAHLFAAAPDHAAIARAICAGIARWEPFSRSLDGGEFCISGLRHSTRLDEFGVPAMTEGMRAAIAKTTGAAS